MGRGEGEGKGGERREDGMQENSLKIRHWPCAIAPGGYCHAPYVLEGYIHWRFIVAYSVPLS